MQHASISSIIEQAKDQRAEYIAGSLRKHPIAALLVVAIPVMLMQVEWTPSAAVAGTSPAPDSHEVAVL